jgi:hypothetical protein
MDSRTPCPALPDYRQLLLGMLPEGEAERVEQHLLHCPACVHTVQEALSGDRLVEAMRAQSGVADGPERNVIDGLIRDLLARGAPSGFPALAVSTAEAAATQPPAEGMQELYAFLAPPGGPGEIGRLGPYRVLRVLGVGGMGVVFLAEDPQLQRRVALKTMKPSLAASASARQRFLREARAAAALGHDHIVTIHQVGEDQGVTFLAMQLLQGETLDDRLRRQGQLPPAEVLRIGREIAAGLAAAHEAGLIHRDIKPANVWLEVGGGRVKILDFGLAKAVTASGGGAEDAPAPEPFGDGPFPPDALTRFGTVVGTLEYIAPEQARGEAVGPACDLFSLGCVLYRLCTGELPFRGADAWATLRAVERDDPPPPRALNPRVPRPLSDLVMRLLAKRPEDRPASARAVAGALEQIPPDPPTARRRLLLKAVAAAVLLGVVGFAGVRLAPRLWRPYPGGVPDDPAAPVGPFRPCHFAPQVPYAVGTKPYCVAVGDFDCDGKPDLAVTSADGVAVFLNNGDGTFRRGVDLAAGSNPWGVAVGDFDGDGVLDLAVAREKADCVGVYLGRGDGTFQDARHYATNSAPRGVAVGDFDGDGKPDLAVANGSGSVSVLLGNGDGTFRPAVHYPSPLGAISVAVADLNGDGKSDLVTSNGAGDTVRVLLGNGDGTFRPGVPYAVGSGPGVVVVADFNGDGAPDIAVENVGTHDVSVLLGNGDGTFRPAASYTAGASPGGLAVADFNGDGKPDLVVANHNSSNVSVLLGNGDGTFRPAVHYAAGFTPSGVAVGDFYGDGKPDVAVANYQGGDVSILLNRPPAPHFRLGTKFAVQAGDWVAVAVTAVDAYGNPDTHYTGTVHLACTDGKAEIPSRDYTLKPDDSGVCSWSVHKLKTAGTHTFTVSNRGDESRLGTITILVEARPATHLSVSAPGASKAGEAIRVTLLARDAFENHDAGFLGTVRVTSSDSKAVLPRDYKFVEADNGGHWLPVTLRTPGEQTITVTDVATGTITGEAKVNVAP